MTPMQDETVLLKAAGNKLILSSHRIRYETEGMSNAELKSIMLEELASIAMVRTSNVILLILAAISLALGLGVAAGNHAQEPLIVGVVGAIIFVVIFATSRHQVLSVASAGTTITVNTDGMKLEAVKDSVDISNQFELLRSSPARWLKTHPSSNMVPLSHGHGPNQRPLQFFGLPCAQEGSLCTGLFTAPYDRLRSDRGGGT